MAINAKRELLGIITSNNLTILNIDITYEHICYNKAHDEYNTVTKTITSLDDLDFEYGSGYGIQGLFGIVYCKDSNNNLVWITRAKYNSREWWTINTIPELCNTIK